MHFKTLVTVNMPTVEEDPHENAAVVQSIELLQARKDDLAKDIMAELTLCTLMGRTTNFARQLVGAVEEVMTPYSTEPPEEYKEFADMTEELKADYAKSVDCLKLPNGKIVECGSYPYFSKYSIVDGKVSQNKVGTLHHTRRTKQSRKIQYLPNCPRQKVYKTFEKYAEDYRRYEYNEKEKGYLDASRYEDFACQVEQWEEISELSEEDYQRYLADVRIPNMIDKGLSDTYWECYWEAVSEAAHTLLREYMDRNTHSDTESGKG